MVLGDGVQLGLRTSEDMNTYDVGEDTYLRIAVSTNLTKYSEHDSLVRFLCLQLRAVAQPASPGSPQASCPYN